MQKETLFFDGFLFSFGVERGCSGVVGAGSVKRVGDERRDRAENERGKIEDAGRQHFGFPRRENVVAVDVVVEDREQRVDVQILQRVPTLVEFEPGLFLDGWNGVRVGVGFGRFGARFGHGGRGLFGGFSGSG